MIDCGKSDMPRKTLRTNLAGRGAALLFFISLTGCSGPMMVTEYEDGMETGEETVIYDDKGHPEITSETGYVADPYAESYSIEKEDFQRQMPGVVPD